MTNGKTIYEKLSASFDSDAIQRADKTVTRKGYDTTGLGYQYIVNRFNEVLGIDGWCFDYSILETKLGKFANSKPYYDITVETIITIHANDEFKTESCYRKCVGGHVGSAYSDALKGAITNSIKKTAALFGVGKQAYEGTLDDDISYEDEIGDIGQDIQDIDTTHNKKDFIDKLLTYEQLFDKISTSKNIFELINRCKKYRTSFDNLNVEQRKLILEEKGRRKLYLDTGEVGEYKDFKIISVEKKGE